MKKPTRPCRDEWARGTTLFRSFGRCLIGALTGATPADAKDAQRPSHLRLTDEFGLCLALPVGAAPGLHLALPTRCRDGLLLPIAAFQCESGPEGIRTPDLLNAIETRSQLRYRPACTALEF